MFDDGTQSGGANGRAKTVGQPANFYPSPFFDVARTFLPTTIKDTFDWCSYYYLTNPLIGGVINKMASYAITDLIYGKSTSSHLFKRLFEGPLSIRTFTVEFNLDRYTFGNALASVVFPFRKMLTCTKCRKTQEARRADYKFRSNTFVLACPCGFIGTAKARDETIRAPDLIRLVRWNPKTITIRRNDITGELRYFYTMPKYMRNELTLGKRQTLESTPQAFIDALVGNKAIEIDAAKIFHARRPSISRDPADSGWGCPLILPVLKDVFLLQVLKKSQEVVALEYIVPFRSLYPEIRADGNNIYGQINLKNWQKSVREQIDQWKKDPAHIAVFPVPIGQQVMGGQGRSLLLHQEIRTYSDQIIAGMGVPTGFFYGEAQYSGASVNLRAMENEFLANRQDMEHLVEFIVRNIARGLEEDVTDITFKPFKMADDLARAGMELNMANAGLISRRTFLSSRDFDYDLEKTQLEQEVKDMAVRTRENAKAQTATQAIMQRAQLESATALGTLQQTGVPGQEQSSDQTMTGAPVEPIQPAGTGAPSPGQPPPGQPEPTYEQDLQQRAGDIAQQLAHADEVQRYGQMAKLRQSDPALYTAVNSLVNGRWTGSGTSQLRGGLPEQLPPRAGPGRAQI